MQSFMVFSPFRLASNAIIAQNARKGNLFGRDFVNLSQKGLLAPRALVK